MKKAVSLGLTLSLTLGGVLPTFFHEPIKKVEASGVEFTKEQQEALNYINDIRKKIGLKPVTLNPFLIKAAENHANYLHLNGNAYMHDEEVGEKGFTGKDIVDRVKAVGGFSQLGNAFVLGEGIYFGKETIVDGIKGFMDTAYHREPLVNPNLCSVGVAFNDGIVELVYAYWADNRNKEVSIYPYAGQKDVPIEFYDLEVPDPLEKFNVETSGYIISFVPNVHTNDINAKLKNSKGKDIPCFKEKYYDTWFLYPKNILSPKETYTVSIDYKDDSQANAPMQNKTWSFTTESGYIEEPDDSSNSKPSKPTTPVKPKVVYADYKNGQYWSEAMLWALDKGLITGYMNVKNPKTGKLENLLKPMNTLTEGQFLTILFRYLYPDELKTTKPKDSKFGFSVVYQLAEKYKLPTKASLKNKADADKPITRGTMARILATAHFKKAVTDKQAVQFMYDAKITNGYPDKNGKYPKTYESFKVNETLLRAHIVTFMKNYDTYLQNNKNK